MQLTDEQKSKLTQWVQEGLGLADVQKKLREECQLSITYMDLRFLVIELGLELKEKKRSFIGDLSKGPVPAAASPQPAAAGPDEVAPPASGVSVDVDRITKPGALVSGTVRFSDGVTASWSLDQTGRLALAASKAGYKPSEPDIAAFQQSLRAALEKMGF